MYAQRRCLVRGGDPTAGAPAGMVRLGVWLLRLCLVLGLALPVSGRSTEVLLNVSFDTSREFYSEFNSLFVEHWRAQGGRPVRIAQSHAASAKQARSVIEGLPADVLSLNQAIDLDAVAAQTDWLPGDWRSAHPHDSSPFYSTVVFLVRAGNPKGIRDWSDLIREGIAVVMPNPKTSGSGRYAYLAAWGFALAQSGASTNTARDFLRALMRNTPILDTGARGASTTFLQRSRGDVLIGLESEALTLMQDLAKDRCQLVRPSVSLQAQLPVARLPRINTRRGTADLAEAFVNFHYAVAGQELAARHGYRPRRPEVLQAYRGQFPQIRLQTIEDIAGSWGEAQRVHFASGGVFDQLFAR